LKKVRGDSLPKLINRSKNQIVKLAQIEQKLAYKNRINKLDKSENRKDSYLVLAKYLQKEGVSIKEIMELMNDLLDGYGVKECLIDPYGYPIEEICRYVNLGYTYDETILYIPDKNKFKALSWGSLIN